MSRSALSRKPGASQATITVPAAPGPTIVPYAMAGPPIPQVNMGSFHPMYPGLMPTMYPVYQLSVPEQSFAPIPLSGDDEDYDPEIEKNVLPCHGNSENFNLNSLLHSNILQSDYFRALYQLRTYHEVLHEIKASVSHVEPWQTGTSRIPSTAYCLLLKLMLMKVTAKQMKGMLAYESCVYVRALGFLYLRYTCPPTDLWKWFEAFLEDEEDILPSSNKEIKMKIGKYCVKLLTDMSYFGTTLPRIPVPVERKIQVMLLLLGKKQERRKMNMKAYEDGRFKVGMKVQAIYSDADNEPMWYDAVIDAIDESDPTKFWVTFPEYGNQECVDLGDMTLGLQAGASSDKGKSDCEQRSRDDSRSRGDRGRQRSRSRSRSSRRDRDRDGGRDRDRDGGRDDASTRRRDDEPDDLMLKVLQSSREASAAVGKQYGQRPASYKGSLSLKMDRFTVRRKSPSRSPDARRRGERGYGHDPRSRGAEDYGGARDARNVREDHSSTSMQSTANFREAQLKMQKLKERYGDASAKNTE